MASLGDRFGLGAAYQVYQVTYDGLKKEYDSKFPRYERACNRINTLKETWARTVQVCDQSNAVQNMEEGERKKKQTHILRAQHDMQDVLNRTQKLVRDLHEGRLFLQNAPVPNFGMQRDTQWIEQTTQALYDMEIKASVLHDSMKRRIDLTNHEGRVLCDRYQGIARSWFGDQFCYFTGAGDYAANFDEIGSVEDPEHILTESESEESVAEGGSERLQDSPLTMCDDDEGKDEISDEENDQKRAGLARDVKKAEKDLAALSLQSVDSGTVISGTTGEPLLDLSAMSMSGGVLDAQHFGYSSQQGLLESAANHGGLPYDPSCSQGEKMGDPSIGAGLFAERVEPEDLENFSLPAAVVPSSALSSDMSSSEGTLGVVSLEPSSAEAPKPPQRMHCEDRKPQSSVKKKKNKPAKRGRSRK